MTSPSIHPLLKRLWSIPTVRAVVWAVSVFILMEVTLFSPNGYLRLAEPKSYVGQIMERRHALQVIKGMRAPVKCAVLGDSRMGEGFSAFEAEEACGSDVIWFNASVSGSTPRTWYQILRSFRSLGCHFDVVFVPLASFEGRTPEPNLSNRALDLKFTAPLVPRWRAISYALSFSDRSMQSRALEMTILKSVAMKEDIAGFLQHPLIRLRQVATLKRNGNDYRSKYKGNPASLTDVVQLGPEGLVFSESASQKVRSYLQQSIKTVCRDVRETDSRYMDDWISRMISECRKTKTSIVFFRHPRGPFSSLYPSEKGSWMEAKRESGVEFLPADAFVELETPSFFFDAVHLNATGRHEFTKRFVSLSRPIIDDVLIQKGISSIHVLNGFSETNVLRGLRQTKWNPWGNTVVCKTFPDIGKALLTTDSHTCIRFGPFPKPTDRVIHFQTKVGFYPSARKWGVSDGVTMIISLISENTTQVLWEHRCLPDDDISMNVPLTGGYDSFFLQFETDDPPHNHAKGDWVLWRDPVLLYETCKEDVP